MNRQLLYSVPLFPKTQWITNSTVRILESLVWCMPCQWLTPHASGGHFCVMPGLQCIQLASTQRYSWWGTVCFVRHPDAPLKWSLPFHFWACFGYESLPKWLRSWGGKSCFIWVFRCRFAIRTGKLELSRSWGTGKNVPSCWVQISYLGTTQELGQRVQTLTSLHRVLPKHQFLPGSAYGLFLPGSRQVTASQAERYSSQQLNSSELER